MNENNQLILIEDLGYLYPKETSKHKARYGLYKCYCGTEFIAQVRNVKNGSTRSCGCYSKQIHTKHGLVNHRLYKIYGAIIQRCKNPNNEAYKYYGLANITICKEWENDFKLFYNWSLANGYKDNLTIDRIDTKGNYEPSNCRWVNRTVQQQNTRLIWKHNKSGYRNIYWHSANKKWAVCFSIKNKHKHIGVYDDIQEAILVRNKFIIDNNMKTPLI